MRLKALARGAILTVGVLTPALATAQQVPAAAGTERQWKVGVRAEAYYDSNLARSNDLVTNLRGLHKDDYVLVPGVTASIVQPFGRQTAFLTGDAGYALHRYNSELDRRRANISGGVAAVLGPCRPTVFGRYQAAQSDLANLDVGTKKNLQQNYVTGVGAQCARSIGIGAGLVLQRSETKNSANSLKESDSTSEAANAQLYFARPSLGTFSAGFAYSNTEFPNRIIPGRPVGDGFFTQSYFIGYGRNFGTRLRVNAQGGITHLKREFSPVGVPSSFNSRTYNADVTYGFGERIEVTAAAGRSLSPSQQVGKTFDKSTFANATVRYKAGDRLGFNVGYVWQKTEANADTASTLLVVTNSETNSINGGVTFSPNDRLNLSLNVRYEDRNANLPQFTYTATRIGVSAQTTF